MLCYVVGQAWCSSPTSVLLRVWCRAFQSVGVALAEEHPVAEQASLVADNSVQRMADIVQISQQFVRCSPLCRCHQRVRLHADHRAGPPNQLVPP